jgi:hypothetical protein
VIRLQAEIASLTQEVARRPAAHGPASDGDADPAAQVTRRAGGRRDRAPIAQGRGARAQAEHHPVPGASGERAEAPAGAAGSVA